MTTIRSGLTTILVATAAWFAIGGASGIASAHAEFQQGSVTTGSTTTVTLDVPNERDAPRFTRMVRIRVPAGWTAIGCSQPAGWTCTTGGGEIDFSFAGGAQQEAFSFTLVAPSAPTTSTFPVVQIYDDGEDVLWSGTAVLAVTAAPNPTVAPSTIAPSPAPGPTTPGASTDGAAASTTVAHEHTDAAIAADGTSIAADATAGSNDTLHPESAPNSTSDAGSDSSTTVLLATTALVLGAIVATATVLVRRRHRGSTS